MARKKASDNQAADETPSGVGGVENTPNVQADHNSVAIGGISIGHDLSGEVNIAAGDIIKNIKTIHQRALTAAEEAARSRKLESKLLAQGIAVLVQNLSTQASEGTQSDSPYKGLLPYGLNEAEIFYGRNKAKKDLLAQIKQSQLTVLHAESGAGKSSLLQAGIAAQLIASGQLAVYLRPHHADPVEFIKRMFLPELTQAPTLASASLRDFLRQVCSVLGSKSTLYLLLDQFEEFFQLKKEVRQPFLESLADCLNDPSLNVRWVLALRKEALSDLAELESFGITQFKNTYRLNRLSRVEARQAMIEPARRHGITFDPALIEHILDTLTTNDEVRPTHLQLVCTALTDDLPEEKTLTMVYYTQQEGGTEGILRDYLKRQLEDLPTSEQILAWKVLRALITADRHRAVKTYDEIIRELKTSGVSKKQIETILGRLVERRLLFTQTQPAAEEVFELAHDYLIKEIELDPQEQALKAAQELLDQETRTYQRHKTLMTAERLAVIQPYQNELNFSVEAKALLHESQNAVQKEKRARERRRNITLGISVAVAIGMSLLAFWGLRSSQEAQNQAELSRAGELAAQSVALRDKNFRLSLLLGIEAFRLRDTVQTRGALLDAANAKPQLDRFIPGFTSNIYTVAFSPDGKSLAAGGCGEYTDGTCTRGEIILWDVTSRQRIGQSLMGHTNAVANVAFNPDGKTLVSTSWDDSIILWNVVSHQPIGQPFTTQTLDVDTIAFSPDGKSLAAGACGEFDSNRSCKAGEIMLWDVASHEQIGQPLMGHTKDVSSVAFSPDGTILASGSFDGTIILWDIISREPIDRPLTGHTNAIGSIAFSPDGKILASGGFDNTVILWDVVSHQPIGQPLVRHTDRVQSIAFSRDGQILASGSLDNTIILWDVVSHEPIGQPLSGPGTIISSIAFSPNGRTLASASSGLDSKGSVILWDVTSQQSIGQSPSLYTSVIPYIAFSPDGKTLAYGDCADFDSKSVCQQGKIILFDMLKHEPIGQPRLDQTKAVYSVAFSPDGKILASSSLDGTILLWNVETRQPIGQPLKSEDNRVFQVAFSPDGKTLASTAENVIILWNVETHQPIGQPLTGHKNPIFSIAFSPSGNTLASASADSTIILWDVASHHSIGQPLVGHLNGSILYSVAFSPDGKTLASGGEDTTVILWDVASQREIGQLRGHTSVIDSIAFSPDGKTIASGSADKSVIWWNIASLQPIGQPLTGHTNAISNLAFSPDGKTLASGSDDKTIIFWNLDPASWIEQSCQRAGGNFTLAEWERYFPAEPYRKTCKQWPLEPQVTPTSSTTP